MHTHITLDTPHCNTEETLRFQWLFGGIAIIRNACQRECLRNNIIPTAVQKQYVNVTPHISCHQCAFLNEGCNTENVYRTRVWRCCKSIFHSHHFIMYANARTMGYVQRTHTHTHSGWFFLDVFWIEDMDGANWSETSTMEIVFNNTPKEGSSRTSRRFVRLSILLPGRRTSSGNWRCPNGTSRCARGWCSTPGLAEQTIHPHKVHAFSLPPIRELCV